MNRIILRLLTVIIFLPVRLTKEKDRRKKQERGAGRKGGEQEKTMAALLVFIIAT